MRYTCTDCHHSIPKGMAVQRSQSFQLVTYCIPCANDRGIVSTRVAAPVARLAS